MEDLKELWGILVEEVETGEWPKTMAVPAMFAVVAFLFFYYVAFGWVPYLFTSGWIFLKVRHSILSKWGRKYQPPPENTGDRVAEGQWGPTDG